MLLVTQRGRLLIVKLDAPHEMLSWAIVNGGRRRARTVVWRKVALGELDLATDPVALLQRTLDAESLGDAVGLLTGRDVSKFSDVSATQEGVSARAVVTAGLSNALSVGDAPATVAVGTINLLCAVSLPLDDNALVEALSIAVEARTAAVMELGWPSPISGRAATGTGTDCVVLAAPVGDARERYAGKHTLIGALIGRSVREATAQALADWMRER